MSEGSLSDLLRPNTQGRQVQFDPQLNDTTVNPYLPITSTLQQVQQSGQQPSLPPGTLDDGWDSGDDTLHEYSDDTDSEKRKPAKRITRARAGDIEQGGSTSTEAIGRRAGLRTPSQRLAQIRKFQDSPKSIQPGASGKSEAARTRETKRKRSRATKATPWNMLPSDETRYSQVDGKISRVICSLWYWLTWVWDTIKGPLKAAGVFLNKRAYVANKMHTAATASGYSPRTVRRVLKEYYTEGSFKETVWKTGDTDAPHWGRPQGSAKDEAFVHPMFNKHVRDHIRQQNVEYGGGTNYKKCM